MNIEEINASLTTFRVDPVRKVHVELAPRDDERVREAVTGKVGLQYGKFAGVAFEGADGIQYFRGNEGSAIGERADTIEIPARTPSLSSPRVVEALSMTIEAVGNTHSYGEPVIYVTEARAAIRRRRKTTRSAPD